MSKTTFEAWRDKGLFEAGVGQVVIARHKSSGDTELGVFLVDAYCLGVKNAFFTKVPTSAVPETLDRVFRDREKESVTAACGRKLIEDAIAYARRLGIEPHPDFKQAARVLGGIDAAECEAAFVFGHEGKPLYVQGPHDPPEFADFVMKTLQRRCGEGNYHYIVGGPLSGDAE